MKKTYYVAEIEHPGQYRKAEKVEAENLAKLKIKASRMQAFYGTILEIGNETDSNGFIVDPILQKINGKWHCTRNNI